jgi:hypothetical protein
MFKHTVSRLKLAAKILLGKQMADRYLNVLPDDVFIVSYPKSGNTWTKFLIGNLVSPDRPVDFSSIESIIPNIYMHSDQDLQAVKRPRLLKSHEYFDPRYKKIIFIVRDPRDVAVSYYHYHLKLRLLDTSYPIDRFVSRFITGELDLYGSWGEHTTSWLSTKKPGDTFLMLRYEDMLSNTVHELHKIASFLNIEVNQQEIERAVERSSAENMRSLEKTAGKYLQSRHTNDKTKPFVRSARSGDWKEQLPPASVQMIETAWAEPMQLCGYIEHKK